MKDKMEIIKSTLNENNENLNLERRSFLRNMAIIGAGIPLMGSVLTACNSDGSTVTATSTNSSDNTEKSDITVTTEPFDVAIVSKAASASLNITEGIETLISLMQEAKNNGARLIVCGELWLPGYPVDLNFDSNWISQNWSNYVSNSITVGDSNWQSILDAAANIGIYVSFGFSEIESGYAYISQALIDDSGTLLYNRRKVRPSGTERQCWSDANMSDNLKVVSTPLGRISMLNCWDHLRPQSTYNVMAQLPNIHICSWPYIYTTTSSTQWWEREEVAHTAASYFSQLSGAYVLLPGVGHTGVYVHSVKQAELLAESEENILYYTITPDNWDANATGSTTSEFSYGVLQLLSSNYPGEKTTDTEHSTLNMVPIV